MSEDCLTVNVFAPASTPATPLPVMVFIYGGGFVAGASLGYESQPLREVGNVVVVTLNYRLGAFGFLEHPALAAAGAPYSNQGLRDQQLALQWVQDNVHVFGGDPNDVTVFGESAGSVSTCAHLFARGSEGLGKKFILESGSCVYGGLAIQARSLAASAGDTVAKKHCSGAADVLACLRAVPATDLVTTTVETADPVVKGYFPWVDGDLFAEAPEALLAKGKLTKGPLLAGTNQFEWYLWQSLGVTPSFLNRTAMQAQIQRYFPANAGAVGNRYLPANDLDAQSAFTRLMTDYYFRCPTRALLRGALAHGSTGYLYDFLVAPAAHALEVDYVFDELAVTPLFPFQAPNPLTRSVVSAMQAYWTAFARHGDPNTSSLLKWPAYDAVTDQHIVLREPLAISKDGAAKDCDFWDELWGLKAP
jgi:para-nitrobenzyl esterase